MDARLDRKAPRPDRVLGLARAAALAAAALGLFGCATPDRRSAEERTSDGAIVARVEAALNADPEVYTHHIDIESKRGVVWLTGWVLSADDSRRAVSTTASVPGVVRVVDGIEVKDYFPH
jgi:osmotically-inducible protein OsmY